MLRADQRPIISRVKTQNFTFMRDGQQYVFSIDIGHR